MDNHYNDLFNYEEDHSSDDFFSHPKETINASYHEEKKVKEKKPVKYITRKVAAIICAITILFAGGAGFGGAYLANHTVTSSTSAPSSQISTTKVAATTANTDSSTVTQVASKCANSVVEIRTENVTTDSFMRQYVSEGAGSGVVLTKDGYLVTNNHVIDGASKITVRLKSGKEYTGKVVGADSQTDLAVVKIDATDLAPATLGDSSSLQVGNTVVAIGNPLGELGGTVTDGIISALDREITIDGQTMNLLQTNAAINPGNSGGGLFDGNGNLIGIVSAKSSGSNIEGLGFAIPINDAKEIINELMDYGYVKGRATIGITTLDISDAQTARMYRLSETGVYIYSVQNSAVASSLKSGDRIVSINGTSVSTNAEIKKILKKCSVGDTVTIVVKRSGKESTAKVKLIEQSTQSATPGNTQSNIIGNNNNDSTDNGTI